MMIRKNNIYRLLSVMINKSPDLTVNNYYTQLLDKLPINNKTGVYKDINNNHFYDIIELFKSKDEYQFVFEALINLKGHSNNTDNNIMDSFIQKALDLGVTEELLEIYDSHVYMSYFPHYNTTNKLLKLFESESLENNITLFKILDYYSLIKLDKESLSYLNNILNKHEDNEELKLLYENIIIRCNN